MYQGNDQANDLFQDFYLRIIGKSLPTICKSFCYKVIRELYIDQRRKKTTDEIHEHSAVDQNGFSETKLLAESIETYIEKRSSAAHDFVEVAIVNHVLSGESLREIERKTGIPISSLCRYYKSGIREIKQHANKNLYL